MNPQELQLLGQAGALLRLGRLALAVDPYLTDSVAEKYGETLRRLVAPTMAPEDLKALDWVLLTHAHEDHTDLKTLAPLFGDPSGPRIMAPWESREMLLAAGFPESRIVPASPSWTLLGQGVEVRAIPAAHTSLETNEAGEWRYVGYLLRWRGMRLYHSGDTIPHTEIIQSLVMEGPLDWALLPVNERNYFRDQLGIIGNMTVREAFQFADAVGARRVVPIHWDMFTPNTVSPDEIALVHRVCRPSCELHLHRAGEIVRLSTEAAD